MSAPTAPPKVFGRESSRNWLNDAITSNQISYLLKLAEERWVPTMPELDAEERVQLMQAWLSQDVRTKGDASTKINTWKGYPKRGERYRGRAQSERYMAVGSPVTAQNGGRSPIPSPVPVSPSVTTTAPRYMPEEGCFYIVTSPDQRTGHDRQDIIRVRRGRGGGKLYAQKFIGPEMNDTGQVVRKHRWVYENGMMYKITSVSQKLTKAQAAVFGHAYGFCIICGRVLDDPQSVAQGIGPVCITKMGWV